LGTPRGTFDILLIVKIIGHIQPGFPIINASEMTVIVTVYA
jgi:hypothetical protein